MIQSPLELNLAVHGIRKSMITDKIRRGKLRVGKGIQRLERKYPPRRTEEMVTVVVPITPVPMRRSLER